MKFSSIGLALLTLALLPMSADAGLKLHGGNGGGGGGGGGGGAWTPGFNTPWSAQSAWNATPVNPVLGGTIVPSYPSSGVFGFNNPVPGACNVLNINNSGQAGATIDMSFITDEFLARNFSVLNFPPTVVGSCPDKFADFIDINTQNLMSFIQFSLLSGTTWQALNFESYPIAGSGMPSPSRPTGPRATGNATFAGNVRLSESSQPVLNHALGIAVDATTLQAANSNFGPKYPATMLDGDFHAYTGNNFHLGSLLMLPSNFNVNALTLPGAQTLARTLMTHGAYIVDTTGFGGGGIEIAFDTNATLTACNTNPCADLQVIFANVREVVGQDGWLDANGAPFTPVPWTQQNLISMRGTWLAFGGGALGPNAGFFNTISESYEFPDTTVTPGTTFTNQTGRYLRTYTATASWTSWDGGTGTLYINPVPGRTYNLTATGTGTGASSFIVIYSGNFVTPIFTSSTLSAGQSQLITWPATGDAFAMYVTKTAGPAASIALQLTAAAPQEYFVCGTGSDSNDGLTSATAWKTVAHVNAQTFVPGDEISFCGGGTFTDALVVPSSGYLSLPITFDSYGTGRATIAPSAANTPGITILNQQFVTINGINVVGQSQTTDAADGVHLENNQAGNTKLEDVQLLNMDVSLFAKNCVNILGSNGTSGFNRYVVSNVAAHDCTGTASSGNLGNAGIYVDSPTAGYGSGISAPSHTNGTINNSIAYNNTGAASQTSWTGSGIVMTQCSNCVIQNSIAHDNGSLGFGSYGIWMQDGTVNTIWHNIVYNQKTTAAGGGAYNIDGGITSSFLQFNYAINNQGPCLRNYAYSDAKVTTWTYNQTSNNICQNNSSSNNKGEIDVEQDATMTNAFVFNNTVYNDGRSTCLFNVRNSMTGYILDNIFDGASTNIVCSTVNTALVFNFNDYYNAGSAVAFSWNGTSYASFALWQAATAQEEYNPGAGSNVGKLTNPVLVSPGGGTTAGPGTAYELRTTSPMIGTGKYTNDFQYGGFLFGQPWPYDYYGNVLISTSWPVGSYSGAGVP